MGTCGHTMKSEPFVIKHTLVNGLDVLLIPQKQAPVVALQGWIKFGAADETDDIAGVAHLFEHLLFKGTTNRKVGQIAFEIEGLGGDLNAYTSYDQTVMHMTLPASGFDAGLNVLADALQNSIVEPDELERERPVILEEIKRRNDMPWAIASDLVRSELFKGHPYARPVIGYEHVVANIHRDKIMALYHQHYTAKNMFLVIAGDIDEGHALKTVADSFRNLKQGHRTPARPSVAALGGITANFKNHNSPDTNIQLGWHSLSLKDSKVADLDAMALIIGQGESSRLARRLVHDEKLVRDISCGAWTPKDKGSLMLSMQGNPNIAKDFSRILGTIRETIEAPFTDQELQKAKKNLLASNTYSKETVDGLAQRFGYFECLVDDWAEDSKYRERVESLTVSDLEEARRNFFNWEQFVAGGIVPEKEKLPQVDLTYKPKISQTQKSLKIKSHEKYGVESFELHGLRVFIRKLNHLPIFSWRWMGLGGTRAEPSAKSGIGAMWARTVTTGGTALDGKRWTRDALNEALDQASSSLNASFGRNSWGLSMDGLVNDLPQLTQIFFATLFAPTFDKKILAHEKDLQLLDIKSSLDQPTTRVSLAFQKAMFKDHALGRFASGETKTIKKLNEKDLVKFHNSLLESPQVLAISGDVDPEKIYSLLECALWGRKPFPKKTNLLKPRAPKTPQKSILVREKLKKEQTHILLGVPTVSLFSKDRWHLMALSAVLSGQGGRLFVELRDKMSLCYTVAPTSLSSIDGGYFAFYIATSPEKESVAIDGLKREIQRLVKEGISEAEWQKAREFYIGNHLIDQQRFGPQASGIALDELYGMGLEEFFEFEKIFRSITAQDIHKVAKKYFGAEQMKKLVVSIAGPK